MRERRRGVKRGRKRERKVDRKPEGGRGFKHTIITEEK